MSVLHVFARRYVFWPKSHARTMILPSFHVHGQPRVTDTRFCPNVRFTRFCTALRFLAKITCAYHDFPQFSCTRATSGYRYTFLPESPFYTFVPGATFFGQNHMRVPCFRPVFMYTANLGCTRATSGYRYTFLPESPFYTFLPRATFFDENYMRLPSFRPVFMYTANVGLPMYLGISLFHDLVHMVE